MRTAAFAKQHGAHAGPELIAELPLLHDSGTRHWLAAGGTRFAATLTTAVRADESSDSVLRVAERLEPCAVQLRTPAD